MGNGISLGSPVRPILATEGKKPWKGECVTGREPHPARGDGDQGSESETMWLLQSAQHSQRANTWWLLRTYCPQASVGLCGVGYSDPLAPVKFLHSENVKEPGWNTGGKTKWPRRSWWIRDLFNTDVFRDHCLQRSEQVGRVIYSQQLPYLWGISHT